MFFKAVESEIKIGDSKIGGNPHLPIGFEYPSTPKGHFMFIGQIKLTNDLIKDTLFPNHGRLYFFLGEWAVGITNRVIFIEGLDEPDLVEVKPPNQSNFLDWNHCNIDIERKLTLLELEKVYCTHVGILEKAHGLAYCHDEFMESIGFADLSVNIFFDWKDDFRLTYSSSHCQSANSFEGVFSSQKIKDVNSKLELPEWQKRMIEFNQNHDLYQKEFKEFICLGRFPSNSEIGMTWGDVGVMQFFIKPEDLKRLDFSRVIASYGDF